MNIHEYQAKELFKAEKWDELYEQIREASVITSLF